MLCIFWRKALLYMKLDPANQLKMGLQVKHWVSFSPIVHLRKSQWRPPTS